MTDEEVSELYQDFYRDEPFVRLCAPGTFPATQFVRGSNYCDIGFELDLSSNRLVVISAIDNLMKGAAGQAVQALNLMYGFDEVTGLEFPGLHPI